MSTVYPPVKFNARGSALSDAIAEALRAAGIDHTLRPLPHNDFMFEVAREHKERAWQIACATQVRVRSLSSGAPAAQDLKGKE